jgi:hypothetical protein
MKKIPKWRTDKKWALRMAKKKSQRLLEVEYLFEEDPVYCLSYAKHVLKGRLPEKLEASFAEVLSKLQGRDVVHHLVSYSEIVKRLPDNLEHIFAETVKDHIENPYGWGVGKCLKYIKNCEGRVSPELEQLFWGNNNTAFTYSTISNTRIPDEYEKDRVRNFEADEFVTYAKKIFKGRMPEHLEAVMIDNIDLIQGYAEQIMFGQLPEKIHTAMIMKSFGDEDNSTIAHYLRFVKGSKNYTIGFLSTFDKAATVQEVLDELGEIEVWD